MLKVLLDIDINFFYERFLGQKISDYLWFAGIIIATILLKRTVTNLLARSGNIIARLFNPDKRYKRRLGQLIRKPLGRLIQVVLYFIAFDQLDGLWSSFVWRPFTNRKTGALVHMDRVLDHIFLFFFIFFLAQFISRVIDFIYHLQLDKARNEKNNERVQFLPLMKEIGKLLVWTICLFWVLGSVFHVNIPALVTGLGIGGIAIALAAKESVENFFAAFTILSDKPFEVGDTIRLANIEGAVERIGFRSTRLRSNDGAAHIIPNQKLVSENLINLSRRDARVVKVAVNIKYGVSHNDLVSIIEEIKKMLPEVKHVKEPVEVLLENFGKDTFQLNISYSLPHPIPGGIKVDKVKQDVNMRIYDIVSKYTAFYISNPLEQNSEEEDQSNNIDNT